MFTVIPHNRNMLSRSYVVSRFNAGIALNKVEDLLQFLIRNYGDKASAHCLSLVQLLSVECFLVGLIILFTVSSPRS